MTPELPEGPLHPLLRRVLRAPRLAEVVELARERIAGGGSALALTGLVPEARGLVLAALAGSSGRPLVVVSPEDREAQRIADSARAFAAHPARILFFPAPSLSPYQGVSTSLRVKREEISDLASLAAGEADLLVASARSLARPLPAREDFRSRILSIAPGDELAPEALAERLVTLGYSRVELVLEPGDFARRGGLVDLFPPNLDSPARIDFFGDFVDGIRAFDADTQRSGSAIARLVAAPFSLFDLPRSRAALATELEERFRGDTTVAADRDSKIAALRDGRGFPGEEHLFPAGLLRGTGTTDLVELADGVLVVDEPDRTVESAERFDRLLADERDALLHNRKIAPPPEALSISAAELREQLLRAPLHLAQLALEEAGRETLRVRCEATPQLRERLPEWGREAAEAVAAGRLVVATAPERGTLERFRRLLAENGFSPSKDLADLSDGPGTALALADLEAGFILPEAAIQISAAPDAFSPVVAQPTARKRQAKAFLSDLRDLRPGDVVVHTEHGLGRFVGIQTLTFEGQTREALEIEYAGGGKLLLPPERLDQLQKYSAHGAEPTKLDKLGGSTFARSKKAAKRAAAEVAQELLELYAVRAQAVGFQFSRDSPWQREFEDAFEFTPTPDQDAAFRDVKRDMENERPMDRLLVGDVGYGKTEVAMRAAMKAVLDGRQVAILAPTTLLAYQHFRTFRRRFASFPVTIELLSRFRSAAAQKEVVKRIGTGAVDLVIGTHRLIAKDVKWKDLGLLVVDEEQRFGVAQKEKIKRIAVGVDILSLSATPIPRTLSMALSGLREMSVIETPPRDRLAVETRVAPFQPELIKEAVAAEVERGGQVYFVHNRVGSMEGMRQYLERLLPGVRIVVAHGQMGEGELEKAVSSFIDRQYDVLLATAIIENGIDITNCNTMLVARADRFGLAQLYQLRGRVGRSDKLAHCYLLVPPDRSMTDTARKRLAALQEFSELGSGFRIAARDLEIRGAGEILGAEQSGHIAAVGFDTYCRLLEEAIREAKGEAPPPPERTQVNLGFQSAIPRSYVEDDGLRLSVYKRIAEAEGDDELDDLAGELADRFGPAPVEIAQLVDAARLRIRGARIGLASVERARGLLRLRFHESGADGRVPPVGTLLGFVERTPGAGLSPDGVLSVPAPEIGAKLLARAHVLVDQLTTAAVRRSA